MKAELLQNNNFRIIKEETDKKVYSESVLYHKIKLYLNKTWQMDLIKKLAYKDGHMVSDTAYILRDRKKAYCYFDADYAIRGLNEAFNRGECTLTYFQL